jgi:predicted chitinase
LNGWILSAGHSRSGIRGRGLILLTGRTNYERWSKLTGIDLVNRQRSRPTRTWHF